MSTLAGVARRDEVTRWLSGGPGSYGFGRRRIDLRDLEKAIGFGIVRPGDERPAHFCAVPAGYDAKPKRLLCLDVTRRKILHEVMYFQVGDRCCIERESGSSTHSRGELASMRCASARATELMEIISIVTPRCTAAGTMIMVATRRYEANDNPSIISSSVMTS